MEMPSQRRLMGGAAFMTLLGFIGYFGQGHVHIGGGSPGYSSKSHSKAAASKKQDASNDGKEFTADKTDNSRSESVSDTGSNAPAKSNDVQESPKKSKKSSHKTPPTQPINLNKATIEELQSLPGIGPGLSQRIIEYRNTEGQFQSLDDLRNVKGIGDKLFDKISPWLTL